MGEITCFYNRKKVMDKTALYNKIVQWYLEEENLTLEDIDLDDFLELKEWLLLLDAHLQSPKGNLLSYIQSLNNAITRIKELIELVEEHNK